jgi:ribonucleoside-diphosphate reductase alpha chain
MTFIIPGSEDGKNAPFGPLGSIVDIRTYRRWLPEKGRRETFAERNARVVNYNCGLAIGYQDTNSLQEEAELLYQMLNELKVWGSGRTAFVGGTKATDLVPESTMNCSASIVNRVEVFTEAFHLLCLGCGFGFRVYPEDVKQLPRFKNNLKACFLPYNPLDWKRGFDETITLIEGDILYVTVGDSREGWCKAISLLLEASLEDSPYSQVVFDLSSVRPEGTRIRGFGGLASGPDPLISLLKEFNRIISLESNSGELTSVNCLDMMCVMGEVVRSGNVRRSSLICLFHPEDVDLRNAKKGIWTDPSLSHKRYRSMSNNSISFNKQTPSLQDLKNILESIRTEGEPGFIRADKLIENREKAAKLRRKGEDISLYTRDAGLVNPCAEINLTGVDNSGQFCNLTTLPLPLFVSDEGNVDWESLKICLELITRFGIRQTLVEVSLPEWNKTQKRERLIGVDLCGTWEAFDKMGINSSHDKATELLSWAKKTINEESERYSKQLGIPEPLLTTCAKPNGSYAQILTIASGIHPPYAPYYIRRIRMAKNDALAQTLIHQGVPFYPETSEWEKYYRKSYPETQLSVWEMLDKFCSECPLPESIKTVVFEFPVSTPAKRATSEITAIEQLENYKSHMIHYIEHNASNTITVGEEEWDDVADWLYGNWDYVIGISLLPKFADNAYPLLPYQECTKEEYQDRVASFSSYPLKIDTDYMNTLERAIQDPDEVDITGLAVACKTGQCAVR